MRVALFINHRCSVFGRVVDYLAAHCELMWCHLPSMAYDLAEQNRRMEDIDLVISMINPVVLRGRALDLPNVNIHPAPLWYRGWGGLFYAFEDRRRQHGVVAHRMTQVPDEGAIFRSDTFDIEADDDVVSLGHRTNEAAFRLLRWWCEAGLVDGQCPVSDSASWQGPMRTKRELWSRVAGAQTPRQASARDYYFGRPESPTPWMHPPGDFSL